MLGGPLGLKPWMSDVQEMLTLFLAVIFFVAGTLAREADGPQAFLDLDRGASAAPKIVLRP